MSNVRRAVPAPSGHETAEVRSKRTVASQQVCLAAGRMRC